MVSRKATHKEKENRGITEKMENEEIMGRRGKWEVTWHENDPFTIPLTS